MPAFDVTASPTQLKLKPGATATVSITVTNRLGRSVLARAQKVVTPPGAADLVKEPSNKQQTLPAGSQSGAGATSNFEFRVEIPEGTPGQSFTFRVDVVEVAAPDDNFGQSQTVGVTVPQEATPIENHNGIPWWVWLIAAVVILAVGVGLWLALRHKDNKIPDLAKKRKPDALAMIDTSKIVPVWVDTLNADTVAYKAAMVIDQKPPAGTPLKGIKGVKDTLRVTVQKSYTTVPPVIGLDATGAATKLGLDSLLLAAVNNDCKTTHTPEEKKVVGSKPAVGVLVPRGSSVTLTVRVFAQTCFVLPPINWGAILKKNADAMKAARVPR